MLKKLITPIVLFVTIICYEKIFTQSTDVILSLDYEDGKPNSGVNEIEATDAKATDAAYMISPGVNNSKYAVAHKIIGDGNDPNSLYYSDGKNRSESSTASYLPGHYYPDDYLRYEFSVYLKDWISWKTGDPIDETNFFQFKMSNEKPVPIQIRTKRNDIIVVYGYWDQNNTAQKEDIKVHSDVPSLVNKWINFRIDVKWTDATTGGFIKVYAQWPGETTFKLISERLDYKTFTGDVSAGNIGYLKWGLYIAPKGVTRIIYHDDLRIINLTPPPTEPGLLWGNGIPDNNPADLDGSYTKISDIATRSNYDNNKRTYLHPYIKYTPSKNIVYSNSTNPAPNANDNVMGTPWVNFSRSTLSSGSISAGRYIVTGWKYAPSSSTSSPLDLTQYYEFYMEPKNGYGFSFTDIKFTVSRGSVDAQNFVLRSSRDNFTSNISSPFTVSGTANTPISFDASQLVNINTPITFRLYPYGSTRTGGSSIVSLFDFQFLGKMTVVASGAVSANKGEETNLISNVSAILTNDNLNIKWSTTSESNVKNFEIQMSKDGTNYTSVKTISSKNGNSTIAQNYETIITTTEMASVLAILFPFMAFFSFTQIKKSKLPTKVVGFIILILILFCTEKCNKKAVTEDSVKDAKFVKIKQTYLNGDYVVSVAVEIKKN